MLIRSQDKKTLVNLDNTNAILIHEDDTGFSVVAWGININYEIGEYSTEEKAIKTLDMIQEEYGKHIYGQGGQMATVDYYVPPFAFIPPKVFQMPQDNGV